MFFLLSKSLKTSRVNSPGTLVHSLGYKYEAWKMFRRCEAKKDFLNAAHFMQCLNVTRATVYSTGCESGVGLVKGVISGCK
ncbi:hypothetical protein AMELA_G00155730 [Ameiurus melas]|uniref:Uncharacterized protein n=1 Tax=Ameiurus melas TaxID=219545 RepID=A0A7J6ADS7_AMEME|nr:hypothetical protein AMELA_G00155730 [Ameiurus melas]